MQDMLIRMHDMLLRCSIGAQNPPHHAHPDHHPHLTRHRTHHRLHHTHRPHMHHIQHAPCCQLHTHRMQTSDTCDMCMDVCVYRDMETCRYRSNMVYTHMGIGHRAGMCYSCGVGI